MNHISSCNHAESYLTGSTVETMIDRALELGLKYFSITDHGYLLSILRGYYYGKEKGIDIIPGVEIFFKDEDCDIIKNTPSEKIRYFKLIIHAKDQNTYQKLVKMCSSRDCSRWFYKNDTKFYLWGWNDLLEISKYNITVTTSDVECMVSKHLLVNRPDLSRKYYLKLVELFGDNFYPSIVPFQYEKYWDTFVQIDLDNEKTIFLPTKNRIETNHYDKATAIELTRKNNKHTDLLYLYINNIRYKVLPQFNKIINAKAYNKFENLPHGDVQTYANKTILALANKYGQGGRVLINDYSYYATKEDKVVQDMRLGEDHRIKQHQHMRSSNEIKEYFSKYLKMDSDKIDKYIKNTHDWADNFKDFELKYDYRLPKCDGDPRKKMIEIIKANNRMKWDDPRYTKQFKDEYELLINNGVINLIPYFLPITDINNYYKDTGYLTGSARGSSGGFLLSYLMGITNVDPIKYGLSSARFLTLDRIQQGNLPDIDQDLEDRTPLVGTDGHSGYLYKKYGNKAAQVSTRTLLRIKSAILDVNRFVNGGKVEPEITELSKSLPNTPQGISDNDFIFGYEDSDGNRNEGLIEISDDLQKYAVERPKEWDMVKRALSLSRQNSRHASAFVISDTPIEDIVPVFEIKGVKRVTQPTHKQVEKAGLIKYDFLVVSALKDIRLCLDYINKKNNEKPITGNFKHNNVETYIWDLPEDPDVFKMLSNGQTETVFQLNTSSVTPFVMKIKPKNILDCATITSLVRPGPLDFIDPSTGRNMAEEYIERRRGTSKGDIPILDELIPETYGIIIFQEQVSKIARELGQMSVEESENVRIAMGKKKIKLLQSLKPKFIEGASKTINIEIAEKVWSMMATFARYGFNKSHAVGYSVISYACAFLKHHYPLEWWASVLSNASDKEINEVFYSYIRDIVLPPDVNVSQEQIVVDYSIEKIRHKLSMINGLGQKIANKIIDNRPYNNIEDFIKKDACKYEMTKKLIVVGVLDSLFPPNMTLVDKLTRYEHTINKIKHENKLIQYDSKIKLCQDSLDLQGAEKAIKLKEKYIQKGLKEAQIDPEYQDITPIKHFMIQKQIFPTMQGDLHNTLLKSSNRTIIKMGSNSYITNRYGKNSIIFNGDYLKRIDNMTLPKNVYFCTPGYVVDTSEFTYHNGSKKALKILIDSSGYISEKVIWPDYNSGELIYDPDIKKGAIVWFFYKKAAFKQYTNIFDTIVEEKSIS